MKISIITVVFNNERTIESAITSVLSQTYKNIEYIIVDGNSTDGTKQIIQKHATGIAKYISENDNGIYDAMNKGLKLATGDVIGLLNSDDIYESNDVINDIAQAFSGDLKLNIAYGNIVYVNALDTKKVVRKWYSKSFYPRFFENGNVPPHSALFVKKRVYEQCGLFNNDFKLAADYEFMLRIFKKFGDTSKYLPKTLVRMRLGGASNSSIKNIIKGNREVLRSWKSNGYKVPLLLVPLRIFKRLIQFI